MSLTETSDRFTTLPDEPTLAATVVALEEHGQHSFVGKILEIRQELPGRIHVVLVGQPAGF